MLTAAVCLLATAITLASAENTPVIKLFAKTEEQILSYPDPNCKSGECVWKIETEETMIVSFEVIDGKLEETEEKCERSSLEAFDGPTLEALKVRQLCVKMEAEVRKQPHHCTWSSGRHLMLRFHQHPQDMRHHFKLRYKSVPRGEAGRHFPPHPPHHGERPQHGGRPFRPHHGSGSSSEERTDEDRFENYHGHRDCHDHEHMSDFEKKMRRCPHTKRRLELIVGVGVGAFGILILTVVAAVCCRKRSQQMAKLQQKREKQRQFISSLGVYQVTIGDEKKAPLPEVEEETAAPEKVDLKLNPDFFNTPPPYTDIDKLEEKLLV